jgi:hypothetical protein
MKTTKREVRRFIVINAAGQRKRIVKFRETHKGSGLDSEGAAKTDCYYTEKGLEVWRQEDGSYRIGNAIYTEEVKR